MEFGPGWRVGKGTRKALGQCHAWVRRCRCTFRGDIVKCLPFVDLHMLCGLLSRRIANGQGMCLGDRTLDSGEGIQASERPMVYSPSGRSFDRLRARPLCRPPES